MNNIQGLNLGKDFELNYLPATHRFQDCILDNYIFDDGKYGYRLKNGLISANYEVKEGEETFYEAFKEGKNILDEEKINRKYREFIAHSFSDVEKLFQTDPTLYNLQAQQYHYVYPDDEYRHEYFYFSKTSDQYVLGMINKWFHVSVMLCFTMSGETEKHILYVTYWDEETTTQRYSFPAQINTPSYDRHIGQRVYFEIMEWVSSKGLSQ